MSTFETPSDPRMVQVLSTEGTAVQAVVQAWTDAGRVPSWHRRAQKVVRRAMPVLAASLDRLAAVAERPVVH